MFTRFTKDARQVVAAAEAEARALGARSIGAEHLLLSSMRSESASAPLRDGGLDDAGLRAAMADDFETTLLDAGVAPELIATAGQSPPSSGHLAFDASAKAALQAALEQAEARRDRRIEARHVALGALEARRGIVPRALRRAGVDVERLRRAL